MDWVWTRSGRCFGYLEGDDLWTHCGKHIGRRHGDDIYAPSGWYIGELMGDGRLITNNAKAALKDKAFAPARPRPECTVPADGEGRPIYMGYQDFPTPDEL